jgi:hypothetical protein
LEIIFEFYYKPVLGKITVYRVSTFSEGIKKHVTLSNVTPRGYAAAMTATLLKTGDPETVKGFDLQNYQESGLIPIKVVYPSN